MEAKKLLQEGALDPEQLAIASDAFETAWAEVQGRFKGEDDRKRARSKLAGMVLTIVRQGVVDRQHLISAALVIFGRHLA